jgi:uncharacterized membrane protein
MLQENPGELKMNLLRRSGAQLALLVLALLGVADAIYLTLAHYDSQVSLICSDNGFVNCARVITSKYSYVPGTSLPISLPGLGWCLVVAALALFGLFLGSERRWLRFAQFTWALLGLLTVLYLVYVEIVLLHNLCAWCTVLHALILLMFLITLVRLPGRAASNEEEWEAEDEIASGASVKQIK